MPVSFNKAFKFWVKLGFINFGGPAGQISVMHRELVDQRKWVEESVFLRGLNFAMLLPGNAFIFRFTWSFYSAH
jgi:chromate transporter